MKHNTKEWFKREAKEANEELDKTVLNLKNYKRLHKQLKKDYRAQDRLLALQGKEVQGLKKQNEKIEVLEYELGKVTDKVTRLEAFFQKHAMFDFLGLSEKSKR